MLGMYYGGNAYHLDPLVVALMVLGVTAVLFLIGHFIVYSFQMLADNNQMKSDFVSIASHQLRAPVSSLKWTLDFVLDGNAGSLNEEQKHYLELSRQSNEHMLQLVNNLLDVSRIDSGLMIFKKEAIDLQELAEEVIKDLTGFASSRQESIRFSAPHDLPKAIGDRMRVRMSMQNLIDNALKYSRPSQTIEVRLEKINGFVKFGVQDYGIGIPKDVQSNIFTKFYRADNTTHQFATGSGLGLFIAKSIIEAMGGKIGFVSHENEGSYFWFSLPIQK